MYRRIKKAKEPSSVDEAYNYALRLLEFRFRGDEELRARLREREFVSAAIDAALEKLQEFKYIDDSRLLEGLIREYKEFGLYGPVYIKQKLIQRKFSREQINEALQAFYPLEDEVVTAHKFLAKQKNIQLDDIKAKQRLIQKFIRRGFSPGIAFKILKVSNIEE
jgi:regulatory protein